MFCPKCGQNLKDGSLFCAYCGTKIKSVSSQPATASVPQPVLQPAPEKKSGKKGGLIAAIVAVVILCFASVVLILFGLSKSNTGKGNEGQLSYYKDFDEDDVVFPKDGEAYVDGQLLITVNDDANEKKAAKVFDSYDGEIVGYNYATNTYQVEFDAYDDDLFDLMDDIEIENIVEEVSLNYVYYNETIVGSNSLDDSLMGISNADYDDSLIGELQVALIGTSVDKSGITDIVSDAEMSEYKIKDGKLVSFYGWECEFANKAKEGCEVFEIGSKLVPTFDDEKGKGMKALNNEASGFIGSMMDKEYNFMILSAAHSDEGGFIAGIKDDKALGVILNVGGAADAGKAPGADVFAAGGTPEALEYATSIALMTWANNPGLSGENMKDIMANSYVRPIEEGMPGILNAELATEVAKQLDEPGDEGFTTDDILDMIEDVKSDIDFDDADMATLGNPDSETAALEDKLKELVDELGYAEMNYYMDVSDPSSVEFNTGILAASFGTMDASGAPYMVVFYIAETGEGYSRFNQLYASLYVDDGGVREVDTKELQMLDVSWMYDSGTTDPVKTSFYGFDGFLSLRPYAFEMWGSKTKDYGVYVLDDGDYIVGLGTGVDEYEEYFSIYSFDENEIKAEGGIVTNTNYDYNQTEKVLVLYDNDDNLDAPDISGAKFDNDADLITAFNGKILEIGLDALYIDSGDLYFLDFIDNNEPTLAIGVTRNWTDYEDEGENSFTYVMNDFTISNPERVSEELISWWRDE